MKRALIAFWHDPRHREERIWIMVLAPLGVATFAFVAFIFASNWDLVPAQMSQLRQQANAVSIETSMYYQEYYADEEEFLSDEDMEMTLDGGGRGAEEAADGPPPLWFENMEE